MIESRATRAIMVVVWLLAASVASAQGLSAGDSSSVEIAAARYASEHFFIRYPARRALDAKGRGGVARAPERVAALSKALGIPATLRDSVITCDQRMICHFRGYDALLAVNIISVADSTVDIAVAIEWPAAVPRPLRSVVTREPMLRFVKRGGRWRFLRVLELRMT